MKKIIAFILLAFTSTAYADDASKIMPAYQKAWMEGHKKNNVPLDWEKTHKEQQKRAEAERLKKQGKP